MLEHDNEFLHRVQSLNTTQLELSTFRGNGSWLIPRPGVEATNSLSVDSVMQKVSAGLRGCEHNLAPANRIAFQCNLNADAMSF